MLADCHVNQICKQSCNPNCELPACDYTPGVCAQFCSTQTYCVCKEGYIRLSRNYPDTCIPCKQCPVCSTTTAG